MLNDIKRISTIVLPGNRHCQHIMNGKCNPAIALMIVTRSSVLHNERLKINGMHPSHGLENYSRAECISTSHFENALLSFQHSGHKLVARKKKEKMKKQERRRGKKEGNEAGARGSGGEEKKEGEGENSKA